MKIFSKKSKKGLDKTGREVYNVIVSLIDGYAGMAELADALDSGSSESNFMKVQVLLPAPKLWDKKSQGFFHT